MTNIVITPYYVAAIAIIMVVLSVRAASQRGKHNVALGDGGVPELALAIRRFGNLSEYAGVALLILVLLEVKGINGTWLHLYGGLLVLFRLIHPIVLFDDMNVPAWKMTGRFISAGGTALLMLVGAVALLVG